MTMPRPSRRVGEYLLALIALVLLTRAGEATAQAIIKIDDDRYVKLGIILQAQADWLQLANSSNTDTAGYQQNLFLRRARLLIGGQIAPDVFFFFETENPRLGYNKASATSPSSGFQVIDALAEWRIHDAFMLDVGLLLVPYSRLALTATPTLFFLDVSAYGYLQQTPTQSSSGNRDTGFQARGYLLDHRLEYRLGAFSGARLPGAHNPLRVSGRLQWEFFDREELYGSTYCSPNVYRGSYQGAKKVLAVGTGFDTQMDFRYYSADVFGSIPTGSTGALEGILQYQYLDGGVAFPTLPVQNTFGADVGYYFKALRSAPIIRIEQKTINGQPDRNEWRAGLTLAHYLYGYNFNIKAAAIRVMPRTGVAANEFTIQLQLFYF